MNQQDRDTFIELRAEVMHIKDEVGEIKESQDAIKEKQEETGKKFDNLMFYLVGDPNTKTAGLVETSRGVEVRLSRLERIYLTVGFIMGILMMFRDKIIRIFI